MTDYSYCHRCGGKRLKTKGKCDACARAEKDAETIKIERQEMSESMAMHNGLPDGVSLTTRMHLTQDMVKDLLPVLTHFAETGNLPQTTEEA